MKTITEIKQAGRGRNFIFGRTFPYRNHQFSSKPNEFNLIFKIVRERRAHSRSKMI